MRWRRGDVVVCPAGGPETAHQLMASESEPLCYLAVSTMNEPDVDGISRQRQAHRLRRRGAGRRQVQRKVDIVVRKDARWIIAGRDLNNAGAGGPGVRKDGAGGRTRTDISVRTADFESAASTNSATPAHGRRVTGRDPP